ncbi:hypothetical protein HHX47_DHR7000354 [Lentinula edodes]|nr:hypothetical protein HHX47_DHR7000354 [Lentinula edodes]
MRYEQFRRSTNTVIQLISGNAARSLNKDGHELECNLDTLFAFISTYKIVSFLGLTYAAVPLYRLFCSATGFAGTPSTRTQAAPGPEYPEWMPEWLKILLSPSTASQDRFAPSRLIAVDPADDPKSRRFKVTFTSSTSTALPWTFRAAQHHVYVLPGTFRGSIQVSKGSLPFFPAGESSLAFYTAKNNSKDDIIGIATYNVTPDRQGHLEPDAPEDVVQESLGFQTYELAKQESDKLSKGMPDRD